MTTQDESNCCGEFSGELSRRGLFRGALALGGTAALTATFGTAFVETAYGATPWNGNIMVVLSMRGGVDGLSLVVPHGDAAYYSARPSIAIPKNRLLAADEHFGLHPALAPLLPYWNDKSLAVVHSAGQVITSRSHFKAMEEIEDSDPGTSARVGWLNRLLGANGATSPLAGISQAAGPPSTQWLGPKPMTGVADPKDIVLSSYEDSPWPARKKASLKSAWQGNDYLSKQMKVAWQVADEYKAVAKGSSNSSLYPKNDLAIALGHVARTIRANVGAQIFTVDHGTWDHHAWVGNLEDGNIKRRTEEWAQALAAFFKDLGPLAQKVTVVTVTEFGRRVKENANGGLDHGHGSVMFALGAHVKGGAYYGDWRGLENTSQADVEVTTDYRTVLGEIVARSFPQASLSKVFPGFSYSPLGFTKA